MSRRPSGYYWIVGDDEEPEPARWDAEAGQWFLIGTGKGQVNSGLCTPSTLVPGVDPNVYLFADRLYPTAVGHRLFGDYAYSRLRQRW